MNYTRYYDSYLEAKVHSASPLQLVHLAYECAIEVVGEAREHLKQGRIHERSQAITRVMKILAELTQALDHARGGEVSTQLAQLYSYMQGRLREANFRQIEEPLIEVHQLLETLASAWKEIASQDNPPETAIEIPAAVAEAEGNAWQRAADIPSYVGRSYSL